MANLIITVPEEVLKRARLRALEQGTSISALLREYLSQFARLRPAQIEAARRILDLSESARSGRGKSRWTRNELHICGR